MWGFLCLLFSLSMMSSRSLHIVACVRSSSCSWLSDVPVWMEHVVCPLTPWWTLVAVHLSRRAILVVEVVSLCFLFAFSFAYHLSYLTMLGARFALLLWLPGRDMRLWTQGSQNVRV
jgi:hypothetical protein